MALMQSAHSHRETSALLLSPTVSSSEDEDMWDMPMDTDHLRCEKIPSAAIVPSALGFVLLGVGVPAV